MAIFGAVAKIGAGMLKGRAKKQTGAEVAAKVTGKKESVYRAKANPNATSSELDAKKIVPAAASAALPPFSRISIPALTASAPPAATIPALLTAFQPIC